MVLPIYHQVREDSTLGHYCGRNRINQKVDSIMKLFKEKVNELEELLDAIDKKVTDTPYQQLQNVNLIKERFPEVMKVDFTDCFLSEFFDKIEEIRQEARSRWAPMRGLDVTYYILYGEGQRKPEHQAIDLMREECRLLDEHAAKIRKKVTKIRLLYSSADKDGDILEVSGQYQAVMGRSRVFLEVNETKLHATVVRDGGTLTVNEIGLQGANPKEEQRVVLGLFRLFEEFCRRKKAECTHVIINASDCKGFRERVDSLPCWRRDGVQWEWRHESASLNKKPLNMIIDGPVF